MKSLTRTLVALLALLPASGVLADDHGATGDANEPTVEQIVDRTNYVSYYQGKTGRAKVKMKIVDAGGQERSRELTILRWDAPRPEDDKAGDPNDKADDKNKDVDDNRYTGEQKFYVYFHRPADVNKTVFLVHKHLDKDDDRWLYLPGLDLVKRIATADKRGSFVGSHFVYEDVSGRSVDADVHELEQTTKDFYVLKNTPKKPERVEFSYYRMYIHRKTFIVVQTDYYDKNDKKYRTYQAKKVKTIDGYPTVIRSRMVDRNSGGYTDMEYTSVEYNAGIPEDVFSERYLRRPPLKHLEK